MMNKSAYCTLIKTDNLSGQTYLIFERGLPQNIEVEMYFIFNEGT